MELLGPMTDEAPMTTTMRETDPECNGKTEGIATIARLLREEVDARVGLEGTSRSASA